MVEIGELIEEYNSGLDGEGPILWHKKPHKNGSGEFACVRGIQNGCPLVIGCPNCYSDKTGNYCLRDGAIYADGFLAVEEKHQKLVDSNAFGAYNSIEQAIDSMRL